MKKLNSLGLWNGLRKRSEYHFVSLEGGEFGFEPCAFNPYSFSYINFPLLQANSPDRNVNIHGAMTRYKRHLK